MPHDARVSTADAQTMLKQAMDAVTPLPDALGTGLTSALPCGPTCPPSQPDWCIPAGILNAFWGSVFPRLVAMSWAAPASAPIDLIGAPINRIQALITTLIAGSTSCVFNKRATLVRDYFDLTDAIPVRVLGEGGFDFVLSDQGLDLFLPPKPTDAAELVRYYTFRATGRAPIGIPFYRTEAAAAIATEAPTGPGQMTIRLADLEATFVRGVPPGCRADALNCLRLELLGQPISTITAPAAPSAAQREPPRAEHEQKPGEGERDKWKPGKDKPGRLEHGPTQEATRPPSYAGRTPAAQEPVVHIGIDRFRCVLAGVRCWQLAGSVYRGIMTELPRVVATIWSERLSLGGTTLPSRPKTYHIRFGQPGNSGLRDIFRERLETAIPGDDSELRMRFETYGGKDVRITNEGLFFPEIPRPNKPVLDDMFKAIRDGKAGNPVFTDSMPPPLE